MIELFGQQISYVEIIGTIFGIVGVWLTIKRNIFCFPAGIVNVALYAYLFIQSKLYADALLQVFYVVLLIYGWIKWLKKNKEDESTEVTKSSSSLLLMLSLIGIVFTILLGTFFKHYTDASLPYIDSLTTSISLVAQWMIAKKKIENWLLWIVADVIYVGMYIYKHLYLTSALYFIFIILAVMGYVEWKKSLADEK